MHEGSHQPLIPKDLYDKAQEVMRGRSKANTVRLKSYVYRGLFHCAECGCVVTMETQKGHNYLHCTKRVKRDCSQKYVREESMNEQIAAAITSHSLPDDVGDWMIEQIHAERGESTAVIQKAKEDAGKQIASIDKKLDRLTAAYLDAGAFSASEFRKKKEESIGAKRKLMDSIVALDRDDNQRFEPVIRFVIGSKQMKYVAEKRNPNELRAKLEQIGSNLTVRDRRLQFEARGAWQLVVDSGSFAQSNIAPAIAGAILSGETHHTLWKWSDGESNPDLLNAIQPSSR
jgi:site-specific DNA recombinase